MNQRNARQAKDNSRLRYQVVAIFALVLSLLVGGALRAAQLSTAGTINGTVVDQTGAAVPGASVTIANEDTGRATETTSNPDGSFSAVGLTVGTYDVTAEGKGFGSYKKV